jgi:hypothetical protein
MATSSMTTAAPGLASGLAEAARPLHHRPNARASESRGRQFDIGRSPAPLSPLEQSFFERLQQALDCDCRIVPKALLFELLNSTVNDFKSSFLWKLSAARTATVDFVLCSAASANVEAVIQLDTNSRYPTEWFFRSLGTWLLRREGIAIHTLAAGDYYTVPELRACLRPD